MYVFPVVLIQTRTVFFVDVDDKSFVAYGTNVLKIEKLIMCMFWSSCCYTGYV